MKKIILTALFSLFCLMLAAAFYAMWSGNIANGFLKALSICACVLAVLLVLFARPKTAAGRVRLVFVYLFLASQIVMMIYTLRMRPQYFAIADGTKSVNEAEADEDRVFIIRESENGKRRLIYATPGDPAKCAWYVIAAPDEVYDTATYGKTAKAKADAYLSECTLYSASTGVVVDSLKVKALFPQTISSTTKREFHPGNMQIPEEVTAWLKNRQQ